MPDTSTEVAIATTTLGSATSTITFSSIPSTYTDLRLVLVGTDTGAGNSWRLTFNNDGATNYSQTELYGNGTSAASSRRTTVSDIIVNDVTGASTTIPTFTALDIFSYAGSTNKTITINAAEDQNGSGNIFNAVGLWRSTSAITTIKFTTAGQFKIGTTATIYGIL